jgi:hypothetical protein
VEPTVQQAPGFCWQNAELRPAPPLAEVPLPPPVPPVAPPVPGVAPPDGVVPAPAAGVVPVEGAGVVPVPAGGVVPVPALVPVPELVDELVLVWLLVVDETAPADEPAEAGTVNVGAPDVLLVLDPPPPQALTPRASTAEVAIVTTARDLPMTGVLMPTREGLRSRAAPCACHSAGSR